MSSPLRPIGWEQLQLLSRKEQIAVMLTAVNILYKTLAVCSSIWLVQVLWLAAQYRMYL